MQPQATRHGVHHAFAAALELTPWGSIRPARLGYFY